MNSILPFVDKVIGSTPPPSPLHESSDPLSSGSSSVTAGITVVNDTHHDLHRTLEANAISAKLNDIAEHEGDAEQVSRDRQVAIDEKDEEEEEEEEEEETSSVDVSEDEGQAIVQTKPTRRFILVQLGLWLMYASAVAVSSMRNFFLRFRSGAVKATKKPDGTRESLLIVLYNLLHLTLMTLRIIPSPPPPASRDEMSPKNDSAATVTFDGKAIDFNGSGASLRRSSRIRLYSDERQQILKEERQAADQLKSPQPPSPPTVLSLGKSHEHLKHTTSAPPHPLLSNHTKSSSQSSSRKTLILDLDETLIHSLAKGNKMSAGHMVEIKFEKHAILYYVHKRPHCDRFLRKVSEWYDVVVFTASVQQYADPVIDWLEKEGKIFKKRYYRQHCTLHEGAYVKDLSLSGCNPATTMIVDNSPVSYIFNEGKRPKFYC